MKTMLIVSMFSLLLIACDNYEFIKENQRFNKRTGEVETLDSNFEWWSLSKLRDAEKKRERARQSRLKDFPYEERKKVTGRGGFIDQGKYESSKFEVTVENNSEWKIDVFEWHGLPLDTLNID